MNKDKIYNNFVIEKPENNYEIANNWIQYKSKVLDLGCATGSFGEYLHNKRKCEVVGVEYSKAQIEIAAAKNCYKQLYQIDLNEYDNQLNEYNNYFDFILLMDVLEHLYDPGALLQKIYTLLNEKGKIIVTIPNISHVSIILSLIQGQFEYTETGLLDNTHIRFFTHNSFRKFCIKNNYTIKDQSAILSTQLNPEHFKDIPDPILKWLIQLPQAFHFQYAFLLERNKD